MGMESENTRRFVAAVNSRTAEENARILGVPVEELLRAGFVDTPAETARRKREFFRDLSDGARDGWRSVSLDHWVLLDGDNVMALVSRVYQGADCEWGWRVARCNGGTDVMVQPCEGTSGGPATLAGAKSAAEAAMSLGSAYDLGLSRAWGQQWEAERERAREKTVAGEVEFVADPADAVRLCMNAVAAAQDALAAARAAVEHAVKLGAGETLREIVGEAVERIGAAVAALGESAHAAIQVGDRVRVARVPATLRAHQALASVYGNMFRVGTVSWIEDGWFGHAAACVCWTFDGGTEWTMLPVQCLDVLSAAPEAASPRPHNEMSAAAKFWEIPSGNDRAPAWALASTSPAKLLAMRDALGMAIDGDARKERDEASAGWAEQTADAARLRIALQEAQQRLVQAHEDIDALRAGDARGLTLNTSIKVKLSEETAAKIYAARVERGVPEQYAGVPADGEGWSPWQVWTFAQEVGPYLHPLDGMPCAMEIRRA